MSTVGYVEQIRVLGKQMQDIRSAKSRQEASSTIEKTQSAISEILTTKAGTRNFDDAIETQFILLDLLKERSWISKDEFQSTLKIALELGKNHRPSDIPEEIADYLLLLDQKERELSSYKFSVESSE
jgi:hypothetical protein